MKRFAITFALLALFSITAQAQGFDWVKTYTGPAYNQSDYHMPVSSVTDADGNLYLLGRFVAGARMDTTQLLPITGVNWICTWIAKLTPAGELAWHKAIYSRQAHSLPYDIRNVGDSAVMVMANFLLPYHSGYVSEDNPVYYLDSLYTTAEGLMPIDSMGNFVITTTAFITLDYDGHVKEQHFLQLGYVDSTGATLRACNTGGAPGDSSIVTSPMGFSTEMFNLDAEGNIYVCRRAADVYQWFTSAVEYREASVENGGIGALRIIVDGERSHYWPVPCRTGILNQQILKFSPHFDTLLDAFYVFDSLSIPDDALTNIDVTAFERDPNGNLYLVLGGIYYPDTMRLSRSDTLRCLASGTDAFDACVIAYNPDLVPRQVFQMSRLRGDMAMPGGVSFHGVTYDAETQSLFLLATVQKDARGAEDLTSYITYRGDTLDLNKNLCWLRVDPADGHLLSYGKARTSGLHTSLFNSQGDGQCLQTNLVVKNNRVFAQVSYQGNIIWRDTMIDGPQYGCGMGVMCWDADGHEIAFVDYGAEADFGNRPGRLHIADSTLWLTGILGPVAADFGTHRVYPAGGDQAYIAHYTDTAFMTTYVYVPPVDTTHTEPIDTGDVRIATVEDGSAIRVYPNPTTGKVFVSTTESLVAATLTDMMGHREEIRFSAPAPGRYSIDLSSRGSARTSTGGPLLLTLTTADGHQHTVRLLKQSGIFGQ